MGGCSGDMTGCAGDMGPMAGDFSGYQGDMGAAGPADFGPYNGAPDMGPMMESGPYMEAMDADFVAPTIGEPGFEAYDTAMSYGGPDGEPYPSIDTPEYQAAAETNFGDPAINPAGAAGSPEGAATMDTGGDPRANDDPQGETTMDTGGDPRANDDPQGEGNTG
jgi:hypothetical protein